MIAIPQGSLTDLAMVAVRADLGLKLLVAVLAGGAIGFERQIAGKPAGLRTNILICVGSALLMDLSIHVGEVWGQGPVGDPARLAAQVVTGIGFIGAGTIMQGGGTITGLTSAATIWVVAAIGLTAGAGFFIEALGATATVMLVLAGLGRLEHSMLRVHRTVSMTVRTKPGIDASTIHAVLAGEGLRVTKSETFDHSTDRVFELRIKGPARQFDIARSVLLAKADVQNVLID
jgi:putative Mg2+ transporter-C (MgtC) family protein